MVQLIDMGNIYYINKHLKSSLDLAVKSASLYEDDYKNPGHPDGKFYIDEDMANANFIRIFDLNYKSIANNNSSGQTIPSIVEVQKHIFIYNDFPSTLQDFPSQDSMSSSVVGKDLLGKYSEFKIKVKNPTVLGIARIRYKTFYGKEIDVLKYSSSQMVNKNNG